MHAGQGTPPLLQAVFFFYPEHDNKNHLLTDHWEELKTLKFTYRVVRVWEESRQSVIERELVGLYPLLPLQDLLAVMGILAGGKYAAEVVYSMIRREMVMQSPVYQEWAKEERIEGRIEKAREDICKFMVRRFGADPDEITQKIGQISSLEILDKLMEELFAANTKEEAQNIIGNGTAWLS